MESVELFIYSLVEKETSEYRKLSFKLYRSQKSLTDLKRSVKEFIIENGGNL